MEKSRWASVGDLIFQTIGSRQYTGVVYHIAFDIHYHGTAYIKWIEKAPNRYNDEYGYSLSNIHNLRGEFDLEKV